MIEIDNANYMREVARPYVKATCDYLADLALATRPTAVAVVNSLTHRAREVHGDIVSYDYKGYTDRPHALSRPFYGILTGLSVLDYQPGADRLGRSGPVLQTSIAMGLARSAASLKAGHIYDSTLSSAGQAESPLANSATLSEVLARPFGYEPTNAERAVIAYANGYVSQLAAGLIVAATIDGIGKNMKGVEQRVSFPEGHNDVLAHWSQFSAPVAVRHHIGGFTEARRLMSPDFPVALHIPRAN